MTFQELFYQYEEQYSEKNNALFLMLLKDFLQKYKLPSLEQIARINQIDMQNGYNLFNCVRYCLYNNFNNSSELLTAFYNLFLKFNGNLKACITHDMSNLGKSTNKKLDKFWQGELLKNPFMRSINYEDKKINIELSSGEKYSFYSIHDYFRNYFLMKCYIRIFKNKFDGNCHNVSIFPLKHLENAILITELLPEYFVGTYYHSIVYHNGLFIDLANQIVYDEKVRKELYQGEIVCETKIDDFQRKLKEANQYFGDTPYAEALMIALHHQALERTRKM